MALRGSNAATKLRHTHTPSLASRQRQVVISAPSIPVWDKTLSGHDGPSLESRHRMSLDPHATLLVLSNLLIAIWIGAEIVRVLSRAEDTTLPRAFSELEIDLNECSPGLSLRPAPATSGAPVRSHHGEGLEATARLS